MHVSVPPVFTMTFSLAQIFISPSDLYVRTPGPDVRPTRRTLAQLHRDLGRSRYTGADLRRLAANPDRWECLRRRARAARWTSAVGMSAFSLTNVGA